MASNKGTIRGTLKAKLVILGDDGNIVVVPRGTRVKVAISKTGKHETTTYDLDDAITYLEMCDETGNLIFPDFTFSLN